MSFIKRFLYCISLFRGFFIRCYSMNDTHGLTLTPIVDIDECENGNADCADNSTCTNTPGSYDCVCRPGFSGNGFTCEGSFVATVHEICTTLFPLLLSLDIDECLEARCPENSTCTNTKGSFVCTCNTGFSRDGEFCLG